MIRKSLIVVVALFAALYPPLSSLRGNDSGKIAAGATPAIRAAVPIQEPHAPAAPRGPGFVINELNCDTPGVDSLEFIEIYDGGVGNLPLFGYVVVFFNGSAVGDGSYFGVDLDGKFTNARGYFVLGNANVVNPLLGGGFFTLQNVFQTPNDSLQNGQDAVGLYQIPFIPPANTAPSMANLIDAVVYDTNDADDPALMAALLNPGQPQVDEGLLPPDLSIQRCPNGSGGQKNTSSYAQGVPTPGDTNNPSCPTPLSVQAPGSTQAPPAIPGNSESNRGSLGSNYVRNVNLFSGEVVENAVDLRVKSRGLDVIWARRYGSRNPRTSAMGNGWDYSYNINLSNDFGPGVIALYDGDGREDMYLQTGPSTWENDQFARELRLNGDSTYTLAFSDGGHWHFFPIDGSPVSGKCDRISDRNNNSMFLFYDGGGRLAQLIDTAGRPYFVGYDPDGFIQSFSDFTGRTVTYQHYQNPDPGGSFGDLASVTTPPVIGTPTCNDFPLGKTMSYTYSEGLAPAERNSNLLTITDPKGQVFLTNTYAPTAIPTALDYDHVTRQVWGPVGNIDIVYVAQTPAPANNHSVVKAIVNDRMGHVKHVYFNAQNFGVIDREYTGIAPLPDSPTTDAMNLPGPPLRSVDPDWFETRYEYDSYGRAVRIVDANLNEELFAYMLPGDDPSPLARGNMATHSWLPGPLGGAQPLILESFSYMPGTSYMKTQHIDGRGNLTFHVVDPLGNVLQTIHRGGLAVDDWTYDPFGQMTSHTLPDNGSGHRRVDTMTYTPDGYVQTNTMDAEGTPATTTYSYDARGNVISQTDPCGNTSLTDYNALDQAMRMQSNEITLGNGNRIETLTYYDANNNVVRVDVENRDEFENPVLTNTHWSTISEYGLLNERIGQCQEVSAAQLPCSATLDCIAASGFGTFIKTESEYNPNGGVTLTRSGAATDGSQPTNVMRTLVDERDLTYQVISAEGDPLSSTAQYDYNGNRGVVRMTMGVGSPSPRVITNTYDGYDRLISTLDPMGNVTTYAYDANHNPVTVEMYGELLDVPGSAGNILLSSTTTTFDPMDLAIARVMQHFNPNTGLPIGDGAMSTQTQYAPTGQVMAVTDDAGQVTTTTYTTANRPAVVTDPKTNRVEYSYDPCGNISTVMDIELDDILAILDAFSSTHTYNGLNQVTATTDAAGTTTQRHDSRGNLVLSTNALGIETRYEYDGLSRKIRSVQDMDADGANGSPADIVTQQSYDSASRLIAETDSKGNSTTYAYDALNRKIASNHADTTANSASHDIFGNVTQSTDANGSVVTYTYDALNRGTNKNIAPGPGVSADTTFETYAYDGMSRIVRAQNNSSLVAQQFDSLSRVISETTNGVTTTSEWDANGNKTLVQYPGGRQVQYAYDGLNRPVSVNDNVVGPLANYVYAGPNRVRRLQLLPVAVTTDTTYNPARMIARTRSTRFAVVIDDRTYQWDPTGNKIQRKDIRLGGPRLTHDYICDAAARLVRTIVSDPAATVLRDTTQTLDGTGSRTSVGGLGTPDAGSYTQDPTSPNPADFQVNQYTTTPYDSRGYDNNGNLTSYDACLSGDANNDGAVTTSDIPPFASVLLTKGPAICPFDADGDGLLNGHDVQRETDYILGLASPPGGTDAMVVYDYRNRMVRHSNLSTGDVATYAYDALGRRIQKAVNGIATNYYHDGWQVIEERDGGGVTIQTYVWGNYVDELLTRQRLGQHYYYHADDMYNIMCVTNAAGNVIERFEYGDYGRPLNPNTLLPLAFFGPGSDPFTGFHGRAYDLETGWYYFRTRYMDPRTGRYTTRVAMGIWGDEEGNSYSFCGNNPWSRLDPIGRGSWFYRWWWWRWYCYQWWKWWCPWRYCGYYCYYWWWWYPYRWWLWWWWPYQWYGYYYWWWSPYWAYCWYPYRWGWWPYRWWWWWYPYRWYGYHCGWWWWWYSWRCWVWYPYGGTWWWWWYPHCWGYYYWWNWWWWNPWRWYWGGWWWYTYGWWGYYYSFYWCYPYRWYWWWYHWWWWPCGWWWQPYGWWGCYYDWWWCWYPYYWWSWWWGWWYPYGWWGWYYGWYWWWYPWGCWYWWWWYPYGWYSWWWGWYWWWWWWPYGWWWWWPYRWWWWWCL